MVPPAPDAYDGDAEDEIWSMRSPRMSWRERLLYAAVLIASVLASRYWPGAWF
jgi:hypothetical protein